MKTHDQLKDELLILRCQTGDSAAFDELTGRWQERLWRYAFNLIGENDGAWDAVQETWIAVVKGIKKLEDLRAFPKWVYRIVSNKCADQIRTRQRQRRVEEESASAEDEAVNDTVLSLEEALTRLPGVTRALLALHYSDGYDMGEIAEIFGIPEGTVKSRLSAARERLRKLME